MVSFIVFSNFSLNFLSSPNPSELEECKILDYKGNDAVNILFFSDKTDAQKYSEFLLTIDPFNTHQKNFNFYYIDSYIPECEIYQEKALLCYDKEMIKKAASCPNDFIAVIQESNSNIRSSAYMNVMSINSKHTLTVLAHEFGHVFVNLAEEYVPAPLPKNAKNCVDNCNKFGIKDGCYQGCSEANYFRSIENGIMRTLTSKKYGIFNVKIFLDKIEKVIQERTSGITGSAVTETDCSQQMYYLIHARYENGKIIIKDKKIEQGCMSSLGSGDFDYTIITEDNQKINEKFNPSYIFTDVQESGKEYITGEVFDATGQDFYLKIPIPQKPKLLEIKKDNLILSQINLKEIPIEVKNKPCKKI